MSARRRKNGEMSDDESDNENHQVDSDEEGGLRIDDIYIPPPPKNAEERDIHGPRLMITKIVNENFKSYAGVKEIGPFHKVGFFL